MMSHSSRAPSCRPTEPGYLCERYGFRLVRSIAASTPDEAEAASLQIGFPVAVKVLSPDIVHKTDVGGVCLGLRSRDEVRYAFAKVAGSARSAAPGARIVGVQVQETIARGVEVIVGVTRDSQFGPVLMFGLGGIFAELLKDVAFRVLPIEEADARSMIREIRGSEMLRGYRGREPVSEDNLVGLLLKASAMGLDVAGRLGAIEFNPIVVWGEEHRVLDAKELLLEQAAEPREESPNVQDLERFFEAKSVAVVGATDTPGKLGRFVTESLLAGGYKGAVYPVNPHRASVLGLTVYPSVVDLPLAPDLVVVTAPLAEVPDVLDQCRATRTRAMVIVSGGGKELGAAGAALEELIRTKASEAGVRVVGCNCIGVFDGYSRLDTFFQVPERLARPKSGCVSMLTQSGTVGGAFLEAMADVGIRRFVSYGNRIDVDDGDLVRHFGQDSMTRVIGVYVEGFRDGRKFLSAAREVARQKPVVIYKAGRAAESSRAAVSHTGFLAGSYGIARAAFRQVGLICVESTEELIACCRALATQPPAPGNRVAIVSNGAGAAVQAIDLFEHFGLTLAAPSAETLESLKSVYPQFYQVSNPLDVTGSGTAADYEKGLRALLADPGVDLAMSWFVFQDTPLEEAVVWVVARLRRDFDKPIVVGTMGGAYTDRLAGLMQSQGVLVLKTVGQWVAAASALARWGATERSATKQGA